MDKIRIANSPFIKLFTETVIRTVAIRKFGRIRREVLNTDLIPSISEETIKSSMSARRIFPDLTNLPHPLPSLSTIPIPPPWLRANNSFQIPINYTIPSSGEYGKLSQLIKETSITTIECNGAEKDLTIIKAGEKQLTKISLSQEEIKGFLELIAKKANVPLIEGVFKAQVDNIEINAVISEVIGARFIIRKNGPYNLIKKKNPPKQLLSI